jgi:alpha-galactosidase
MMENRMKTRLLFGIMVSIASLWLLSAQVARAVSPTPAEMAESRQWAASHFEAAPDSKDAKPFFSFTYDGRPSAELLKTWKLERATRQLDDMRTERTLTYTDPKTGLVLRCVSVEYKDFPTVEWTFYFKNAGDKDTPILSEIQALDIQVERAAAPSSEQTEFRLHHQLGSLASPTDYRPFETLLTPELEKRFSSSGGKPTSKDFPYFNLQMPGVQGMIVVVGWPGQWAAKFTRDKENHVQIRAGQELTHFKLLPGEEVRTPLIVLQFWKGDRIRAQNLWRRWMFAHNLPRPEGKPLKPMYIFCSGGFFPGLKVSEASEKLFIDTLTKEGIQLDYWWMDAGWYPCTDWPQTGTWEVDPERFPKGIKAISDYVHERKMKLIVWFEPERVYPGTWLAKNHPEWILGGKQGGLLNLGNPDAWKWLTEHVNKLIDDQGIDLYRQDFNMFPLNYWRGADAEDRQGITENKHVVGYLAYWDDILRRHPNMLIDTCASGGMRNDLETLRRAVPLLRSDYQSFTGDPAYILGNQCQTYGISSWIPFYGTGVYYTPVRMVESFRSHLCPSFGLCTDVRKNDTDWNLYRKLVDEWRQVAGCMLGDYYPLTPYSLDSDRWIAWQFDRPEQSDGMIQAFRRAESVYESIRVKLRGLEPDAVYIVKNLDEESATEISGRELMDKGLSIVIKDQPGSALITYRKKS